MSKSRMVNTRFWSDGFVVDKLNALDRYLFLYLLTNERTNILGIYELSLRTAAFETGIEKDDLTKMLARLSPKVEYFDGWVYIRQFTSHQQSNPSVDKGMMREFFALPDSVLASVKELGIDSPKLQRAFDMLTQAVDSLSTDSGTLPVTKLKPNLNLNLTKPTDSNKAAGAAPTQPAAANTSVRKVKTEEIDQLFSLWLDKIGYAITSQVKSNREYAGKLIREYSTDDLERMISGVALSHSDKYAPRISNFKQLYHKWDDLKAWGKRSLSTGTEGKGVKI